MTKTKKKILRKSWSNKFFFVIDKFRDRKNCVLWDDGNVSMQEFDIVRIKTFARTMPRWSLNWEILKLAHHKKKERKMNW